MVEYSLLVLSTASAIILVASFVQSLTGFGFALVCVPLLVLVVAPKDSILVSLILGATMNVLALAADRLATHKNERATKQNGTKLDWWLMAGALCGIPLGSLVLAHFDPGSLRLLVGVSGAMGAIAIGSGRQWPIHRPRLVAIAIGLVSGVLNTSTSMGGVPVALYMANRRPEKHDFRGYLLLYILLVNLIAIASLVAAGLVTTSSLRLSALLAPAMVIGIASGAWSFSRLSSPLFTKVVVYVVLLSSAMAGASILVQHI